MKWSLPQNHSTFILGSGNFHGLTFCSLHAMAAAQFDDGRRVHVFHPVSRGAYLGTFSQVHLTPRENFKKHVMVFLVCGLVMMTIIIIVIAA